MRYRAIWTFAFTNRQMQFCPGRRHLRIVCEQVSKDTVEAATREEAAKLCAEQSGSQMDTLEFIEALTEEEMVARENKDDKAFSAFNRTVVKAILLVAGVFLALVVITHIWHIPMMPQ